MEFSLSLDRCDNSSCMHCELGLYIHKSSNRDRGLFYLLTWMVWISLLRCCTPSIVLGSAVSWGFYWPGVVYWWLLRLGPDPKTFQRHHPPYSVGVFQSISNIAFHVDASPTWYVMLVLGSEGFPWWWLTGVLFT